MAGIDITFENEEKHYRASMLIKKYKVCDYDGCKWVTKEKKECEVRSTYIYEDMFMNIPCKHPTPILAVWTISATFAPC